MSDFIELRLETQSPSAALQGVILTSLELLRGLPNQSWIGVARRRQSAAVAGLLPGQIGKCMVLYRGGTYDRLVGKKKMLDRTFSLDFYMEEIEKFCLMDRDARNLGRPCGFILRHQSCLLLFGNPAGTLTGASLILAPDASGHDALEEPAKVLADFRGRFAYVGEVAS